MKYVRQLEIIIMISFIGEELHYYIPIPVPASIYGLLIMFLCLHFHLFETAQVKNVSDFLIETMTLMFIPPAVGLMVSWERLRRNLIAYIIITFVSTFAVMIVSGQVTQLFSKHCENEDQ
jgi:holin-like protein